MGNFMTTSRKPPLPPKPKLTRAPAKLPDSKNPITAEIMQRIRRQIAKSNGLITIQSIAEDIDIPRQACSEYLYLCRATPGGDRLAKMIRWLAAHDPTFTGEVIHSLKVRFRGEAEEIIQRPQRKLSEAEVAEIRKTPSGITGAIAKEYGVSVSTVRKIRSGLRY